MIVMIFMNDLSENYLIMILLNLDSCTTIFNDNNGFESITTFIVTHYGQSNPHITNLFKQIQSLLYEIIFYHSMDIIEELILAQSDFIAVQSFY